MDPYDTSVSDILGSKEFLMKHPGASQLGSDLYSSSVNSVSEIMLRQRYTGQYVSQANNLVFGGQSSFFITPGSILNGIILSCAVALPQYARAPDFWLLNAIDSVEMIISGSSSVQSLKISGRTHMDYIFASLNSNKIEALRSANPFINNNVAITTYYASVPLHLFFSSDDISAVFPLDTSTLQSQIILNVRWKQNYNIFSSDVTGGITLPTSFTNLYMRVGSQVVVDNGFALSNRLRSDRDLIYSLPINYLQTYSQVMSIANLAAPESSVTLTSMPSGQLQCILCSISEVAREGLASTAGNINPYTLFGSIRMLYNGIEVYRADTLNELTLFNSQMADDDSLSLQYRDHYSTTANTQPALFYGPYVVVIPMGNDVSKVLRERRHEHTKDYSGSSLQFFFTVNSPGTPFFSNSTPITGQPLDYVAPAVPGNYRLNFTFVNAGLIEVSQQTVSLVM
jgi:hypothetical protein